MDFKKTVKAELEEKYAQMLDESTPMPYTEKPQVNSQQSYKNNNRKYHSRLEAEKSEFNNACRTVNDRRNARIKGENDAKDNKAEKRFKRRQRLKTVIFYIPVLIALFVGLDIFNVSHGQIAKAEAIGMSLGWMITLFVFYCLFALITAITLTVKMYSNETFVDRNTIYGTKPYTVWAVILFILSAAIIWANLSHIVLNLGKDKITFTGVDTNIIEYMEKDDTIELPEGVKSDKVYETHSIKYTFVGWDIDSEMHYAGETFDPEGWQTAKAIFTEREWCKLSVSASNAKITVSYGGQTYEGEKEYEIPRGTQVTVTASFSYSDTSFSVGGSNVSNPHTFTIDKNTSAYASSSDPGCLVEGTQITLANGTTKAVEDLQMGDMLAIFNHESGKYEVAPLLCNIHANVEAEYYDVINLYFSDGTLLRIVDEHGLFDKNLNKYVYIDEENVQDFVGHNFVSSTYQNGELVSKTVTLDKAEITNEYIKIFNPASVWHINLIANDMLTLSAGMVNLFEYDKNMKYDETLMAEDIEKYGLYTYDDFDEYVSIEVFNAFPFKYYKVAIGKGLYTYEQLLGLIQLYNDIGSVK